MHKDADLPIINLGFLCSWNVKKYTSFLVEYKQQQQLLVGGVTPHFLPAFAIPMLLFILERGGKTKSTNATQEGVDNRGSDAPPRVQKSSSSLSFPYRASYRAVV
jgi:hypothetical protein